MGMNIHIIVIIINKEGKPYLHSTLMHTDIQTVWNEMMGAWNTTTQGLAKNISYSPQMLNYPR